MLSNDIAGVIDPASARKYMERFAGRSIRIMEVCGTHTMAIAECGLKRLLPDNIKLISGPGCPVCVTPAKATDALIALAERSDVTLATYGDMLKVPGTVRHSSLASARALGADIRIVYSPMDAVELTSSMPERKIVFVGIGFETTAPGTAAALIAAKEAGLRNFFLFPLLKRVEPALRALIRSDDFAVDAFLCPGHVASITGACYFDFLPKEYGIPAVVSGFEKSDLLTSVLLLLRMLDENAPDMINEYTRAVKPDANPAAARLVDTVFKKADGSWRGLGEIGSSALVPNDGFASFDAFREFGISGEFCDPETACACADIVRGAKDPRECPFFGTICTPEDPVGPCMVSSEGSCAAAYKYSLFI